MNKLLPLLMLGAMVTPVCISANKESAPLAPISQQEITTNIRKVRNYYRDTHFCDVYNWIEVTYQLGVLEAYKATGEIDYYNECYGYAEGYSWEVNEGELDTYLDNVTSSMLYCMLHDLAPADYKLKHSIEEADYISVRGMLDSHWIDEIYMIGLTQSYLSKVTGNQLYSDVDYATYMYYRQNFFDCEDGLWYRDGKYIWGNGNPASTSPNGKKVYWSRGNTWVYVSLAQRLEYMDKNDKAYQTYLNDYLMMSNGLLKAQRPDGTWGANLGDIKDNEGKEMTGTGGFLYGLCLGIEYGLLDYDTYFPIVDKCYRTIVRDCIYPSGLLGYCQPVGEGPWGYPGGEANHTTSTNAFGVGLVLMGLSRFMRICEGYETPTYTHQNLPFNPENAKYTVDKSFYKGLMFATTNASWQEDNGPENIVNGIWKKINKYSRFSGIGLSESSPITVDITIKDTINIKRFDLMPYQYRAYKFTLEALINGEYVTVIDTRYTKVDDTFLYRYPLENVISTNKLRLTGYGYHNGNTNMFSIKELFIYTEE